MRRNRWLSGLVVVAATAVLAAGLAMASGSQQGRRPNVVVLITDDQTVESLRVMPRVRELLVAEGTTFSQAVVSYPLCCPSRATYLTGQYAHNHRVRGNHGPTGGYAAFRYQDQTLPVALQAVGYRTIHIGKYMNGYGYDTHPEVPPGWDEWRAPVGTSGHRYFGVTRNENGQLVTSAAGTSDYRTDVDARLAVSAIRREARLNGPFFLDVSFLAPHSGDDRDALRRRLDHGFVLEHALPPPRHQGRFATEPLPLDPAFGEDDVSDKPAAIQALPPLSVEDVSEITAAYRSRLESLLAVDEAVGRIVAALEEAGELENTVIVFTSDNGFMQGEHRVRTGKTVAYEPSIRVPLVIRAPRTSRGATTTSLVANIDLAPTILELAGASSLRGVDGRSMLPLLHEPGRRWHRPVLLERMDEDPGTLDYEGLRTGRWSYIAHVTGETELYDLRDDPGQLVNRSGDPALSQRELRLAATLARLSVCAGATCGRGAGGT